ncbi:MAG TPA: CoA pyrophosphatase [Syntrophorhabdaceae bacterium]
MMLTLIRERLKAYHAKEIAAPQAICAGVVMPIFEKDGADFIVLTKRSDKVRIHKGEVSFPGGMCEDDDGNTMNTALRECCEEIGVSAKDVEIIGKMDDMVTLTGFVITPYVGIIPYPYQFKTNPEEVERIITLPIGYLRETIPHLETVEHEGRRMEKVPSFFYQGDRIWGATCRILLEFKEIIGNEKI